MRERILLAEDDRELREFLTEVLLQAGYEVSAHASAGRAFAELKTDPRLSLVLTDLVMPGMGGRDLLDEVRAHRPELNVIVLTAFGTIESAIELVKAGAYDYLTKPFGTDELLLVIERALEESRLLRQAAANAIGQAPPAGFIGRSEPMQELYTRIRKVAGSPLSALIIGETGTGKELVTKAIQQLSGRAPRVAVHCAALPEPLLESELFGYTRGAFTGADRDKPGLFETAHGGILFLDEIGELPLSLQPKLLRALEQGEVRRVGSPHSRQVDVRILAATNRDLEQAVGVGEFREDLFWRLNVVSLCVPPLRERASDVPALAEHFLKELRTGGGISADSLSPSAIALLVAYPWPGNVRELRNVIEGAATLATGPRIEPSDLPARVRETSAGVALSASAIDRSLSLRELERRYIQEVLRQTEGNRSRAAEILGLDRKTLYRKLQEYDRQTS
jgi:DNA-binding NtrC family response regulator